MFRGNTSTSLKLPVLYFVRMNFWALGDISISYWTYTALHGILFKL